MFVSESVSVFAFEKQFQLCSIRFHTICSYSLGLFLYEHILNGLQRFVSIRWARNPTYALSEENGKLRFKVHST